MYLRAMTTSSSAALPARSPSPATVTLTQVAPAWMPGDRVGHGHPEVVVRVHLDLETDVLARAP